MLAQAIQQAQAATLARTPAWKKPKKKAQTVSLKKQESKPKKQAVPRKPKPASSGATRIYWNERNAPFRLKATAERYDRDIYLGDENG